MSHNNENTQYLNLLFRFLRREVQINYFKQHILTGIPKFHFTGYRLTVFISFNKLFYNKLSARALSNSTNKRRY